MHGLREYFAICEPICEPNFKKTYYYEKVKSPKAVAALGLFVELVT